MAPDNKRWLAVIGIGEDGIAGLGDEAKRLVAKAAHVFGGTRHLELASDLIRGKAQQWPTPFDISPVIAHRGTDTCVLASGDPFFFGVGATLARDVSVEEMIVLPAPSSFSLAASRLGWALQDVETVSLHGRPVDLIRPLLHPKRRILALTSDGNVPREIAKLLADNGFGASRMAVLEALGGRNERLRSATASGFDIEDINPLNILAIEVESSLQARILPLTCGMPDELFENDGQLTKREVRAVTLSALAPCRGELLWDIGAGSGSIGIEWMLADPAMRAVAIEANPTRAALIRSNATACGVPRLKLVEGQAPQALSGLETPDAIFIGGGGSDEGVMDAAIAALKSGGRLVANAVTLEMEAVLLAQQASLGGDLTRIAISRVQPIGSMHGWRPAMPVTQWRWVKP